MQMVVAIVATGLVFAAGVSAMVAEQRRQAQLIPVRIKRSRR